MPHKATSQSHRVHSTENLPVHVSHNYSRKNQQQVLYSKATPKKLKLPILPKRPMVVDRKLYFKKPYL